MSCSWEELKTVFSEMLHVYQNVLQLGYRKREALVQHDLEELDAVKKQEETLVFRIVKLDGTYENLVKELSDLYGLTVKKVTLSQLVQLADQETQSYLKQTQQELSKITSELNQVNDVNKKLVEKTLSFVKYNINLLTQHAVDTTYVSRGQASSIPRNRALFDGKA